MIDSCYKNKKSWQLVTKGEYSDVRIDNQEYIVVLLFQS